LRPARRDETLERNGEQMNDSEPGSRARKGEDFGERESARSLAAFDGYIGCDFREGEATALNIFAMSIAMWRKDLRQRRAQRHNGQ
jgi:hypothetical protein